MRHLLPELNALLRTDMSILDEFLYDENTLQSIPSELRIGTDRPVFIRRNTEYTWLYSQPNRTVPYGRLPVPVVSASIELAEVIPLFATSPLLLIKNDQGEYEGYIAVSDVLHAMMHAHRLIEAYFETTLETAGSALTLINEEAKVAYWTTGAEHVFSISKKDIIGQPAADFFPPDRLQSLKTLYTGETVYRKQHQPRPDLFALINARPVQLDGHIVGAVAAEVDITTEIRLHQELLHMTSKVQHLEKAVARLRPELDPFARIKGSSPVIQQCMETIRKISTTSATVLILGESGTGKELFAKAIHDLRELQTAPFIAINCGAIPASLFESELFGYEKGAFSGADPKGKRGKIELAEGGTLFLDEIGEMPLELQVKLLRVLQEKSYFPVGGTRMKQADCRIIAATNQNLMSMIARNQFREDLYYRLNVINLVIPPLRMRKEDIYELTQTFLQEFSLLYNRHIELVPPEVFKLLFQYDWPGNVRELRNVIERLTILTTDGEVKSEYLPDTLTSLTMQEQSEIQLTSGIHSHESNEYQQRQDSAGAGAEQEPRTVANADELDTSDDSELVSGVTYQQKLDTYEAQLLIQYLKEAGGNKRTLAKQLGISRATLYNRMKRLGL
ncbi:sigma-54-dependent Fis family transcriptional regulator [Paenibacillus sp. 1781tsa1]|uniref:sigma-54 interaction domain-containing protein n=1 Tax=Paenibacillus sp. 1781tsa1 TaxID=2953810 RepID=UPI00209E0E95|nr:sigma 54-interacting transcriptional regulator [Paenibacillus sp. 1781tsa1]MCP1182525.1 sigma 54-interacting transcriptional regulator [Paenibacillus sp. 1781tsa1]